MQLCDSNLAIYNKIGAICELCSFKILYYYILRMYREDKIFCARHKDYSIFFFFLNVIAIFNFEIFVNRI